MSRMQILFPVWTCLSLQRFLTCSACALHDSATGFQVQDLPRPTPPPPPGWSGWVRARGGRPHGAQQGAQGLQGWGGQDASVFRPPLPTGLAKNLKIKKINDTIALLFSPGLGRKHLIHLPCRNLIFIFTTAQKGLDCHLTIRKPSLKGIK